MSFINTADANMTEIAQIKESFDSKREATSLFEVGALMLKKAWIKNWDLYQSSDQMKKLFEIIRGESNFLFYCWVTEGIQYPGF